MAAGHEDARTHQLEQQTRCGGAPELGEGGVGDVGDAHQLGRPEGRGLGPQPVGTVARRLQQTGLERVGDGAQHHEVAQPLQEVLGEAAGILPGLDDLVDDAEDRGAVGGRERTDRLIQQGVRRVAEQLHGQRIRDALGPGATEQLVEDAERVSHRPGAGPHDERHGCGVERDALAGAQLLQVVAQRLGRHQPEGVVVRARADGADDLVGLGGGEDELQVRRRLLDELEQRVEALRRDHVGLVDDVDLVAAADRGEERALAQVAGVVDTAVTGGVDLDDVDTAGPAARQVAAALALAARVGDGALLAVERARQDAGTGGLAAAARAAEQVGVIDPVGRERVPQRVGDVVLTDDLGERLRPVAAIQGEGGIHLSRVSATPDTGTRPHDRLRWARCRCGRPRCRARPAAGTARS